MKLIVAVVLVAISACASAQPLLEFRNDLAFDVQIVDAAAARAYRAQLETFATDHRLDADPLFLNRLRRIVDRLKVAATIERADAAFIPWEIHTCRRCNENASAMAGGKLLVGEEFVSRLKLSDDELGYLVAHEMGHVLSEHSREYATTARFFAGNGKNRDYEDIQNELNESIVLSLDMASLARHQEFEADFVGFVLGARSGFEPAAMMQLLQKLSGEQTPSFGPHTLVGERIARATAMLETARRIRESFAQTK